MYSRNKSAKRGQIYCWIDSENKSVGKGGKRGQIYYRVNMATNFGPATGIPAFLGHTVIH